MCRMRGAVSIARRLQDPLAELVKIEPKAIGVGQYQHDVNQSKLARALDARVEDCVNAVGVDVNTASAPLLARVAGPVGQRRGEHRRATATPTVRSRAARMLLKVPRLGDKAFEQAPASCASAAAAIRWMRVAVHPEAYPVVERILEPVRPRSEGHHRRRRRSCAALKPEDFTDETLRRADRARHPQANSRSRAAIRDPISWRRSFRRGRRGTEGPRTPAWCSKGRVTNVAAFGAFVDIGVHQDGLVHVSALSHTFVKDPRDAVKAGDVVKVKVMEVDLPAQAHRTEHAPGRRTGRSTHGPSGPARRWQHRWR